ncbi:MAG: hypothetical protein GXN99_02670 [Candidatus Nanohaloarchaeota archaeon]|nr:hypothetical protein [Candidatus Nanohaloarchaeota archaeon]
MLVKFFSVLFISFILAHYLENAFIDTSMLQVFTAKVLAYLLGGEAQGAMIVLPQYHLYVQIIRDCIGWKTLLALISLWLIIPLKAKTRIFLIAVSFPLAFFINLQRIMWAVTLYATFGGSYSFWDEWAFRVLNGFFIALAGYLVYKNISTHKK